MAAGVGANGRGGALGAVLLAVAGAVEGVSVGPAEVAGIDGVATAGDATVAGVAVAGAGTAVVTGVDAGTATGSAAADTSTMAG